MDMWMWTRMFHERTAKKIFLSTPVGRRPKARTELDGKITLKILVDLALAFYQNIYSSSPKIAMPGGCNWRCCPRYPTRINGSQKHC